MECAKVSASQQTFIKKGICCFPSKIDKRNLMETTGIRRFTRESAVKKLSKGQLVYIKDIKEGWITGTVEEAFENIATVYTDSGKTISIHIKDVHLRSGDFNFVDCCRLTEVTPINEASVLECLHQRFLNDIFYTSAGTTIVAVNPFKNIPHLYDMNKILEYHQHQELLSPHIYLIAENAYISMVRELGKINQSIVVSGESGAGKTVSAKHLLRYLTIVSSPEQEASLKSLLSGSTVERRVLDSNPILEAFGNAATPRNENSSRFGKFIQLQFHRNGFILGGAIQTYLLEKTRVVHQGVGENNFHIFYQLLSLRELSSVPQWLEGIKSDVERSKLQCTIPLKAETVPVLQIVDAMTDIGMTPETQVSIFQVLLAILHLTAIRFASFRDGEESCVSDDEVSNWSKDECSRILGISPLSLHHALLNRNIISGTRANRSVFVKPVTVEEARSRRDCLAMLLYARLFDWLINFINQQIKASHFDKSISLLDIYGFEAFDINGLEQLCINYANERLQQHYVTYFLRDLQTEYEMQCIPWSCVSYRDNKTCVESLDGPTGVFGVLNEEVHLNRKSHDSGLCSRIVSTSGAHGVVRKSHAGTYETTFYVRHYAGDLLYTVAGAVTKNKDNIPQELISLLGTSDNSFVLNLFTDEEFAQTEQSLTPPKLKRKKTVLTKFKSSLDSLISSLDESDTHYIRCIKPNSSNEPNHFDRSYVLQQLQACGTLETVEICRMGYPARMVYHDFIQRYGVFSRLSRSQSFPELHHMSSCENQRDHSSQEIVESFYQKVQACLSYHDGHLFRHEHKRLRKRSASTCDHEHKKCIHILMTAFTSEEVCDFHLQFGLHKIFLTQAQLEHLEHTRATVISALVTRVQATWRATAQRKLYQAMKVAAEKVQKHWRAYLTKKNYHAMKEAAVKIQRVWRNHKMKLSMKKLLKSYRIIKKSLLKCLQRRRLRPALKKLGQHQEEVEEKSHSLLDESEMLQSSSSYVDGQVNIQMSLHDDTNIEIIEAFDHVCNENDNESSGHWSDDSGVMIKDDSRIFPADPIFEAPPPPKKQKVAIRSDLRIGNGIITCRRLTKPGYRFHVRKSVLKYGHVIHYNELVHGLPDALPELPSSYIFNQPLTRNLRT